MNAADAAGGAGGAGGAAFHPRGCGAGAAAADHGSEPWFHGSAAAAAAFVMNAGAAPFEKKPWLGDRDN